MCEASLQMLTWTNSLIPGSLIDYCNSDVMDGEAPLDTTPQPLLGEAPLDTTLPPLVGEAPLATRSPPNSASRSLNTLPPTHCNVLSSEPVNGTVLSLLVINGELLAQSLNFTCRGNKSGSSLVQLLVANEPYFITRPQSTANPIVSLELVLECGAIAGTPPAIIWLRRTTNGTTPLSPFPRLNVTTETVSNTTAESTLTVEGVTTSDGGEYICQVSSNGSVSQTTTVVTVRVPANITEGPVDSQFRVGAVATLSCHTSGVPLPMITWSLVFENGSHQLLDDLSLANNYAITTIEGTQTNVASSNLTFPHFQLSDIGRYACNAMNGVSLPQGYTQYQAAYLDIQPVECSADEVLCSSRVQCVPSFLHCDLTADCADGSDEDCAQFPASIVRAPDDVTVTAFNTTSFMCQSLGEDVVITWFFSDQPLVASEGLLIEESVDTETGITSSSVTLLSPSLEDAGVYLCTVSNGVPVTSPRTVDTASASLVVLPIEPSIEILPKLTGPVAERDTLHLECYARASPPPLISWLRNGGPLTVPSSMLEQDKYRVWYSPLGSGRALSVLTVQQLLPGNDDGEYTCRLDNINDPTTNVSVTASVTVSIATIDNCFETACFNNGTCVDRVHGFVCLCVSAFEGPDCRVPVVDVVSPEIVQSPLGSDVEILTTVELLCDAVGSPQPTFSWLRDGVPVADTGPVGVLRLSEVRPEDRGFYTCTASNIHGTSPESAAGLLTIRGVYQYLVNVTDCSTESQEDTLELMTLSLVGNTLTVNATLYSVTARPLQTGPPPHNQVLVTLVTGSDYEPIGPTTADLQSALLNELAILTASHDCNFPHIRRYDGCPEDTYSFSTTGVLWEESDISPIPIVQSCPCGSLNRSREERYLSRVCGGTFRLGGEWEAVNDQCGYSFITHGLCDITNFRVVEQFSKVETATQEIALFNAFDLSIVTLILTKLASSTQALNSTSHQESFVQTYSHLLQANKEEVTKSQRMFKSTSELLESLEVFVLGLATDNGSVTSLNTELVQVQVEEVGQLTGGRSYVPQLNVSGLLVGGNITLPPALLSEGGVRVANLVLLRDTLFVFDEASLDGLTLGNLFISASLVERVEGLSEPVTIEFSQSEMPGNETTNATCVFWDLTAKEGAGAWSSEGCRLVAIQDGSVTCECDHLTHFGLLLAISPVIERNLSLEIITYIGIGLSLVCIAVVLVTYLCSSKLREKVIGQLIINMCVPLGLFYAWFLVAIHGRYYDSFDWFCFMTSSLVQYFLLVYLAWTTVEALHIYLKLVKVFGSDTPRFVLKSAVYAWVAPAPITALCTGLGIHYNLWAVYNDNTLFICYPRSWPLYFGVIAPFVLMFLFNVTLFVIVMVSLIRRFYRNSKMTYSNRSNLKELRNLIVIGTTLSVLFGLGWAFGLVAQIPQPLLSSIAQYIFSVFVGFQGTLIFVLHGVRSADVRRVWKQWFYKALCCLPMPPGLSSSFTSSQVPSPVRKTAPVTVLSTPTSPELSLGANRHSENPLYQSTDALDTRAVAPDDDETALIQEEEWQSLEVKFTGGSDTSSDEEPDLRDLERVPFSDGQLGTAIGADSWDVQETSEL